MISKAKEERPYIAEVLNRPPGTNPTITMYADHQKTTIPGECQEVSFVFAASTKEVEEDADATAESSAALNDEGALPTTRTSLRRCESGEGSSDVPSSRGLLVAIATVKSPKTWRSNLRLLGEGNGGGNCFRACAGRKAAISHDRDDADEKAPPPFGKGHGPIRIESAFTGLRVGLTYSITSTSMWTSPPVGVDLGIREALEQRAAAEDSTSGDATVGEGKKTLPLTTRDKKSAKGAPNDMWDPRNSGAQSAPNDTWDPRNPGARGAPNDMWDPRNPGAQSAPNDTWDPRNPGARGAPNDMWDPRNPGAQSAPDDTAVASSAKRRAVVPSSATAPRAEPQQSHPPRAASRAGTASSATHRHHTRHAAADSSAKRRAVVPSSATAPRAEPQQSHPPRAASRAGTASSATHRHHTRHAAADSSAKSRAPDPSFYAPPLDRFDTVAVPHMAARPFGLPTPLCRFDTRPLHSNAINVAGCAAFQTVPVCSPESLYFARAVVTVPTTAVEGLFFGISMEFLISQRVLHQLRVWSGDQDRVVLVMPAISVSVVVNQILGTYMVPIVHHDDVPTIFLIRLPSPADVATFDNHSWRWITEEVFFRRVSRLVHHGVVVVMAAGGGGGRRWR
ncbi:hypothetical protein HU200_060086 [Digitaria exilis]|uniref:Uncharacterized protein n=1 Tax=Digitaria exilis TaxID=1010633 RepID=A0A835E0S1_9POAL|nr:hypothetical protein HU200_060086 [Digitaria exilis]